MLFEASVDGHFFLSEEKLKFWFNMAKNSEAYYFRSCSTGTFVFPPGKKMTIHRGLKQHKVGYLCKILGRFIEKHSGHKRPTARLLKC